MEVEREARLVREAQQGNRESFRELITHYERPVYRLAYALTREHERATELAHDSFSRAWSGLKGMPEGKRFFPWVLRIARNLSVTHGRRRAGTPTSPAATAENAASGHEDREERMREALRELRPDEQMALALRVVERLPYKEIAELLDHSVGVTLARLSTARGVLLTHAKDPGESAP
jgi:RNA polymerase sigma-70 factor (ECF subfamily)